MASRKSKRRQHGMGSLRLRGKKWYLQYRTGGHLKTEIFETEEAAEERLDEVRGMRRKGRDRELHGILLRDLAEDWIEDQKTQAAPKAASTLASYGYTVRNHLLPAFGGDDVFAHQVTTRHIENYARKKGDGLKPGEEPEPVVGKAKATGLAKQTVRHQIEILGLIFKHGIREQWLSENPVEGAKLQGVSFHEAEPFEDEVVAAVLRHIPDDHRALVSLLVGAGLRFGEAAALRWEGDERRGESVYRSNGKTGRVFIRGSLKRAEDNSGRLYYKLEKSLKTEESRRELTIGTKLHAEIIAHKERMNGYSAEDNLVFHSQHGTALNPANWRNRVWLPAIYLAHLEALDSAKRDKVLGAIKDRGDRITIEAILDGSKRLNDLPSLRAEALGRALKAAFTKAAIRVETSVHNLRHTYASKALRASPDGKPATPVHVVSKRMGHASIVQTYNTYSHMFAQDIEEEADTFDAYAA